MSHKKLFRSIKNKKIAGVCSGFADFFNLDTTIIRLTWILISCFSGTGIILYILCIIIIPIENENTQSNVKIDDEIKLTDDSEKELQSDIEEEVIISDTNEIHLDNDENSQSDNKDI